MTSPSPGDASDPALHPAIESCGVLLVEDCSVHRGIAVGLLREAGVSRVYEASDGVNTLMLLNRLQPPPVVIVLDLELPRLDAAEALRVLAERPDPPALLLVGGRDPQALCAIRDLARGMGLQLLGALAKPLVAASLRESLSRFQPAGWKSQHVNGAQQHVSEDALFEALHDDRIFAHYQPRVDLRTGLADGLEALARWVNPDGSIVPPSMFVPVADRANLMDELTRRMLQVVLSDLATWHAQGFPPKVAINVSCQSLSRRWFTDDLLDHVERAGVAPGCLTFEVTETAVASDPASALSGFSRLRSRGFGLSLDDYGTGFSSLQQLARMPFSELKIDRSFVAHAHESERQRIILSSAIDVGRRLGMSTVAEGIETEADLATVVQFGCDKGQGYLFARPMPPEAVLEWHERDRDRVGQLCARAQAR